MSADEVTIHHVSDTAIWVAYYRALESERSDALFRDDLAKILVGTRGREIADNLKGVSRYPRWSVVIRTLIIDKIIQKAVSDGVDLIINLGAGLDTRPYRLDLPRSLRWVEVDYANIIEHKEKLLGSEVPGVNLERIGLDLANIDERKELFARLNSTARSALVLTEGVVPYLTKEQVASLAGDLRAEPNFRYWITEFFSPEIYRFFRTKRRTEKMKNAPFRFFPANWFDFFRSQGWVPIEIKYLPEEAIKVGREMPLPWWARLLHLVSGKQRAGSTSQNARLCRLCQRQGVIHQSMKTPVFIARALLAQLLILPQTVRADEPAQPAQPPAAAETPAQVWSKIMLIGASVTRGFTQEELLGGPKTEQFRLDRYLSAALMPEHVSPKNVALALFFLRPIEEGRRQVALVEQEKPTLVVGLDFLFWYCYGPNKSESVRSSEFETGLIELTKISCPLVLGDLPDISKAVGGIVTADEIPAPETLAAANRRLREWAMTRPNVMILPLAAFMDAASNNRELTSGRHTWAAGTTRALLQSDTLHPGRHGAAVLALAICEALHNGPPALPLTAVRWDPKEVFKLGSTAAP